MPRVRYDRGTVSTRRDILIARFAPFFAGTSRGMQSDWVRGITFAEPRVLYRETHDFDIKLPTAQ